MGRPSQGAGPIAKEVGIMPETPEMKSEFQIDNALGHLIEQICGPSYTGRMDAIRETAQGLHYAWELYQKGTLASITLNSERNGQRR